MNIRTVFVISVVILFSVVPIIIILSQIQKPASIDAEFIVGQASFLTNDRYRLINSVSVNSVYLKDFKEVRFNPKSIIYGDNDINIGDALVEIKPIEDYSAIKIEGNDLGLVYFDTARDSKVTIHKYDGENTIDVKVLCDISNANCEEESDGQISVGNSANIRIERCLVNRDGKTIVKTDDNFPQKEFRATFSSKRAITFAGQPVFNVVPIISEEISNLSLPLQVRNIDFNDEIKTRTRISTLQEGTIRFRNLNRSEIKLGPMDYVYIQNKQPLEITKIGLVKQGIKINLSGLIKGLKIGRMNASEQVPSLLEYLYEDNKKLHIIISTIIWLCGFIGGILSFYFALKDKICSNSKAR